MAILPSVGGDSGIWGDELNAWLQVSHNADGTPISSGLTAQYGEYSTTWSQNTTDTTTWITGLTGSGQWNFTFTPTGSSVIATFSAYMRAGAGAGFRLSYAVKNTVSGAILYAPGTIGTNLTCNPGSYASGAVTKQLSGLTASTPYTLQTQMQGQGNTTTAQNVDFRSFMVLG